MVDNKTSFNSKAMVTNVLLASEITKLKDRLPYVIEEAKQISKTPYTEPIFNYEAFGSQPSSKNDFLKK